MLLLSAFEHLRGEAIREVKIFYKDELWWSSHTRCYWHDPEIMLKCQNPEKFFPTVIIRDNKILENFSIVFKKQAIFDMPMNFTWTREDYVKNSISMDAVAVFESDAGKKYVMGISEGKGPACFWYKSKEKVPLELICYTMPLFPASAFRPEFKRFPERDPEWTGKKYKWEILEISLYYHIDSDNHEWKTGKFSLSELDNNNKLSAVYRNGTHLSIKKVFRSNEPAFPDSPMTNSPDVEAGYLFRITMTDNKVYFLQFSSLTDDSKIKFIGHDNFKVVDDLKEYLIGYIPYYKLMGYNPIKVLWNAIERD